MCKLKGGLFAGIFAIACCFLNAGCSGNTGNTTNLNSGPFSGINVKVGVNKDEDTVRAQKAELEAQKLRDLNQQLKEQTNQLQTEKQRLQEQNQMKEQQVESLSKHLDRQGRQMTQALGLVKEVMAQQNKIKTKADNERVRVRDSQTTSSSLSSAPNPSQPQGRRMPNSTDEGSSHSPPVNRRLFSPEPPQATAEPKSPSPTAIKKLKVSGGVLSGYAIKKFQPQYPTIAKAHRAQGQVQVQVTISVAGRVTEAEVISGHILLRDAALQAAKQWVFKPTELSGYPVQVQGVLTFNFTLQ